MQFQNLCFACGILLASASTAPAANTVATPTVIPIAPGWSTSSINTVVFRHGPLATFNDTQYAAFYDGDANVVLAKRKITTESWETRITQYHGNAHDAHNTISIGVDGNGILHMAWDHHNNHLNYVQTKTPESLELTDHLTTDGIREESVTYPEFYSLANGDLLFTYRVGTSGNGDTVLKRYNARDKTWITLQSNLIAGKSQKFSYSQNAYTEMNVDSAGTIHLGWVWRRTPNVQTNHDICYAKSSDGGKTWTNSAGQPLALPMTDLTCEVAVSLPEKSDLINQTTLAADDAGHPYIATYYKTPAHLAAQIMLVYNDGQGWKTSQVGERHTHLDLGGTGTRRIPLSRPLVLIDRGPAPKIHVVFRDVDRGDRISLATINDIHKDQWVITDLSTESYGYWEPGYDANRWHNHAVLDLFIQNVDQLNGADSAARKDSTPPTMVSILEYRP